jgi:Arc/MetJ-type ribon-helix-helix transcriptional regulator
MTTQIAVRLPDRLVSALDALVADGTFDSRSEAVRHGLEALVSSTDRSRVDQAFREGFRRQPDRADELADAARLATDAINDEPWDRWW